MVDVRGSAQRQSGLVRFSNYQPDRLDGGSAQVGASMCSSAWRRLAGLLFLVLALSAPAHAQVTPAPGAAADADATATPVPTPADANAEVQLGEVEPLAPDLPEPVDEAAAVREARDEAAEAARHKGIEQIEVTAQKRKGNLQETPIAISVFDMQQLDTGGIQDFEGLSFSIPNFHYGEVLGAASITIRGVATSGGDQATAFHIDGIYQNNPYTASGIAFYDLQNIEVLRGPQGTLWGRNATGGAINVSTKAPSYDFEAFGDAQVGSYHEIRTRGVINVPLVDDRLAIRLSGVTNRRYGYTENLASDVRSGDLDDDRSFAIRSQVRTTPIDDIDWTTRVTYVKDKSNGLSTKIDGDFPALVPLLPFPFAPVDVYYNAPQPNPSDPREVYLDTETKGNRDFLMANTHFEWLLGDLPGIGASTLTVLGGWQRSKQVGVGDVDLSDAFSVGIQCSSTVPSCPNAGPYEMVAISTDGETNEWVAEANFSVETPLPLDWMKLNWLVGAFYLGTNTSLDIVTDAYFHITNTLAGQVLARTDSGPAEIETSATSTAIFGNLDWELWDQVTLSGGLRYSWDWKDADLLTTGATFVFPDFPGLGTACAAPPIDAHEKDNWDALTGKIGADWQYTEENMVYASFAVGYKAGAVSLPVTGSGCTVLYPSNAVPEQIFAWELGSKNQFWKDKIQLNVTGFAYVYEDIQVTTLLNTSLITENADSARVLGAELEVVALPFADFDVPYFSFDSTLLTANFGYTYSEFTDFDNGCLVEDPSTCGTLDWTGNQLPRSPNYTFTITGQYTQDLGRYGSLTPFFRYFYSDQLYFRAANRDRDVQPSYQLADITLTWRNKSENLSLEGFVNNVGDVDVIAMKLISTPLLGSPTVSAYNPPRTWGLRFGVTW